MTCFFEGSFAPHRRQIGDKEKVGVIALAILLGRLPKEELKQLIAGPPRKKYTRKKSGEEPTNS